MYEKGRRNGESWRSSCAVVGARIACYQQVQRMRGQECNEFNSSVTHHRPCRLPVFASMPPSPAQSAFLVHAWHGALCPRHARFVASDGGRYHRRPPRGARYTGQPVIVVVRQPRRRKALHCTDIDGGRDHAVALFYATEDGAE
jgi:hypothetical protein